MNKYEVVITIYASIMALCIIDNGGTRLAIEGVDFEIIPAPARRGRYA